jgi:hypothetical protein
VDWRVGQLGGNMNPIIAAHHFCHKQGLIDGCQGYQDRNEPYLLAIGAFIFIALIAIVVFRPRRGKK